MQGCNQIYLTIGPIAHMRVKREMIVQEILHFSNEKNVKIFFVNILIFDEFKET